MNPMKDPVCGMTVDPARAAGTFEHEGHTYHFCGKGCLAKFQQDPAHYLNKRAVPAPAPVEATPGVPDRREYTCPMDPEVRQIGPGTCPKCGMALEPLTVTLDETNPELDDMVRRFTWALVLTAPILLVMVADLLPGQPLHQRLPAGAMARGQFLLATSNGDQRQRPPRIWDACKALRLRAYTFVALATQTTIRSRNMSAIKFSNNDLQANALQAPCTGRVFCPRCPQATALLRSGLLPLRGCGWPLVDPPKTVQLAT
jgi:Cu+-exporting ATPase